MRIGEVVLLVSLLSLLTAALPIRLLLLLLVLLLLVRLEHMLCELFWLLEAGITECTFVVGCLLIPAQRHYLNYYNSYRFNFLRGIITLTFSKHSGTSLISHSVIGWLAD